MLESKLPKWRSGSPQCQKATDKKAGRYPAADWLKLEVSRVASSRIKNWQLKLEQKDWRETNRDKNGAGRQRDTWRGHSGKKLVGLSRWAS